MAKRNTNGISPLGMEVLGALPANTTQGVTMTELVVQACEEPVQAESLLALTMVEKKAKVRAEIDALRKLIAPMIGDHQLRTIYCTHRKLRRNEPKTTDTMGYVLSQRAREVAEKLLKAWTAEYRKAVKTSDHP